MKKLNDKWFRIIGIPLIALMGHLVFYNRNDEGDERFGFWGIYLISLAETMLLWEINRLLFLYFRNRFPSIGDTRKRITGLLLTCTPVTLLVRTVNIWVYDKTLLWGYRFPLEGYLHSVFVALLFVLIVGAIYEALYYFSRWNRAFIETERLKKENLQTQFDSLKAQINPHFLFNNLSTLASLITEDQRTAVQFVEELADVYRYLLQANEKTLVPVQAEINFAEAYYHLLKRRFENRINLTVAVNEKEKDGLLPPLTLQLLLENAVKHNAILEESPLEIKIYTEPGYLVVENSLHEKSSAVRSTGMGLNNISSKYKILRQPDVLIIRTATHFIVKVPLIKPT
ncbi:MAG: histidine kinase [Sphingobacteriales bacterium]|nr:histidine kinase [Sphingobacteriales bacterium]